jgi:hypothetical protein
MTWDSPANLQVGDLLGLAWRDDDVHARFIELADRWERLRPTGTSARGAWPVATPESATWYCMPGAVASEIWLLVETGWTGRRWDSMALELEMVAQPLAGFDGWTVMVELRVECWCQVGRIDHGYHPVRDFRWMAGSPQTTLDALDELLTHVTDWLERSRDPEWWRRQSGLPLRSAWDGEHESIDRRAE